VNTPFPRAKAGGSPLPLPGRQFQRFILVFHVVFIAGLGFILLNRLQRAGSDSGWPEITLTLIILSQIAIYLWFFALPIQSPRVVEWWGFYFPVSFSLWFITWRMEPSFEWMVLGYLGQMFGALAPKYSLPGGAAVFLLYLPAKLGWAGLARLTFREWLGYLSIVVAWTALGLFLHKLVTTSAERARLIEELERAQREVELARQRDTELAGLRERERLARELHDSLGHGLVTLTVQLEAAQRLYASDPAGASVLMDQMKNLTRSSMEQLRRSLAGLRTPGLGDRSFGEALKELCAEVSKRGNLQIEYRIADEIESLSPALTEALWRAAQEGLANVERHAQATEAQVSLEFLRSSGDREIKPAQVLLHVTDNGIGLPPRAEDKPGHYGLRGLRERIEGVGGQLRIAARESKGTILEARMPCAAGWSDN
jgi:signal transduction histidine kinase